MSMCERDHTAWFQTFIPRLHHATNKEADPLADDSSKYRRERISAAVFLIGFIAYSVFLVVATHLPQVHTLVRGPGVDKLLHLFVYILYYLVMYSETPLKKR